MVSKFDNLITLQPRNGFDEQYIIRELSKRCHLDNVYQSFFKCESSGQLGLLQTIVSSQTSDVGYSEELLYFLAVVYFETPSKDPVKGYINKLIPKAKLHEQEMYVTLLSRLLVNMVSQGGGDFTIDMQLISKMSKCLEVDAGITALETAADRTLTFFKHTLQKAVTVFSQPETSPTLKKGIMTHCHETLRLLLVTIQKYHSNGNFGLKVLDEGMRMSMKDLLNHPEMPMDTKSLGGIVLLRSLVIEFGEEPALQAVFVEANDWLKDFLKNDTEVLVIYNGLSTKPPLQWTLLRVADVPAVIKVLDELVVIGERASSDAALTVSVGRAINQLAKYLGMIDSRPNAEGNATPGENMGPIDGLMAEKLLAYVLTIIDHSMDSVRHLAGQTLSLVANFYIEHRSNDKLFEIMANYSHPIKRSYFLIAGDLISNLKNNIPDKLLNVIIEKCISALYVQEVQAAAATCLVTITSECTGEGSPHFGTVFNKLMVSLEKRTNQGAVEAPVLELYDRVLSKILILDGPSKAEHILHNSVTMTEISDWKLIRVLVIFRASQKTSIIDNLEAHLIDGVYELLLTAGTHPREEYRILALSIVVESQRTTRILRKADFKFLLQFLKSNANSQSPHFRQLITALLNKFVLRLRDSFVIVQRDQPLDVAHYAKFVSKARAFCFMSLHPGCTASRRITALSLLRWIDCTDLPNTRVFTKSDVELLLKCLEDSYEHNKQLALGILLTCPSDVLQGYSPYEVSLSLEDILREASSVKPTSCESAAYKLVVLERQFSSHKGANHNILHLLLERLKKELAIAKENVVLASATAPMYGLIHCMRKMICKDVGVQCVTSPSCLFVAHLFRTLMEVNRVVTPIVSNSSPEGHLPMDLAGLDDWVPIAVEPTPGSAEESVRSLFERNPGPSASNEKPLTSERNEGNPGPSASNEIPLTGEKKVTAQMVLLCGWRSVKEVALLLGELCHNFPAALVTDKQLKATGEHLLNLLSQTKHRGAFEQACVAFKRVVPRLWASKSPALHTLPYTWLKKLISQICSSNNMLCPTRRSAGLPYIIQALVTTDIKTHGSGKYFNLCMNWLLRNAGTKQIGAAFTIEPFDDNELFNRPSSQKQKVVYLAIAARVVCKKDLEAKPGTSKEQEKSNDDKDLEAKPGTSKEQEKSNDDELFTVHGDFKRLKIAHDSTVRKRKYSEVEQSDVDFGVTAGVTKDKEPEITDDKLCREKSGDIAKDDSKSTPSAEDVNAEEEKDKRGELELEVRTHCLNILRALYRDTNLGEAVSSKIQDGLMVAICGLNGEKFQERNSANLLLNALMVRVFGVLRAKDAGRLHGRNKMTARIFFLRYPAMYEFMMDVITYAREKESQGHVCHSLFGVLLILSRLYQSSLEGTDSNFKLCGFVEPVRLCAASSVLKTRRLAAEAIASIVPPHLVHEQVLLTLSEIGSAPRSCNELHGMLLQAALLIFSAPPNLTPELQQQIEELLCAAFRTVFGRERDLLSDRIIIRNEMLTTMLSFGLRFNRFVIKGGDVQILTNDLTNPPNERAPYYHKYIVNLFYYTCILHLNAIESGPTVVHQFIGAEGGLYQAMETRNLRTLTTIPYEILLAEIDFLLILRKIETGTKTNYEESSVFRSLIHKLLQKPRARKIMTLFCDRRSDILYECLSTIIKGHHHLECKEKALMLLNTYQEAYRIVVESTSASRTRNINSVALQLVRSVRDSPDKSVSLCLQTLVNMLAAQLKYLAKGVLLMCLGVISRKGKADNSDDVRAIVAKFLTDHFENLLLLNVARYRNSEIFELKAILWSTMMTLLEDESQSIRESAATLLQYNISIRMPLLATKAGEALRYHIFTGAQDVRATIATFVTVSHVLASRRMRSLATMSSDILRSPIARSFGDVDDRVALMCLMALYDFHAEVRMQDDAGDSHRVFDQNERHNVYMEEIIWTRDFVSHIIATHQNRDSDDTIKEYLTSLIQHPNYESAMAKLCNDNFVKFKHYLISNDKSDSHLWNPKVKHFADVLDLHMQD